MTMPSGKTILITGGTGSFGTTVLKYLLDRGVAEVRILSRDEEKQDAMRNRVEDERVRYYIGDVRDYRSVEAAIPGTDYVYHAAALKQVPSCEFYPIEAVKTNVLGTENVLRAATKHEVSRVICLSTDKAVYPINAMGMSKALMEKVMVAQSRTTSRTIMVATRYGNVIASRGSVVPLFIRQVLDGRPLTVTDPSMTRFMMSLQDAVDLVQFAFEHGRPGDILVQKAPAATIGDLAEAVLQLFSADNGVEIIGTRHGEKLFETLLTREELTRSEDLGAYYRVAADTRDLNYRKYFSEGEPRITGEADYTSHAARRLDVPEIKELLMSIDEVRTAIEGAS